MSPARTAGAHRRTGPASLAAVLDQLRQARAERDQLAAELAERNRLLAAYLGAAIPGETVTLELARTWAAESWDRGHDVGYAAGVESARHLEGLDFDEPGEWPVRALGPLPTIDPYLDRLRYPPHGRARFGEPRPGDYQGGPVLWPSSVAGVDVEAVSA